MDHQVDVRKEHEWLRQLVGEWTCEGEAMMGPDQPAQGFSATETVRTIGDIWVQCEGRGEMPGAGTSVSQLTLGFDPRRGRFVGTFIVSMMTHLWVYDGRLDDTGRRLVLDTEGPAMPGPGTARYQDIIEFLSPDHRTLTSQLLGADGQWTRFMTAHYRRR